MKKALVLMAPGFEEIELTTVVDLLRRAEIDVTLASIDKHEFVRGAHEMSIKADKILSECETNRYDALVLPGGWPGALNLFESGDVQNIISEFAKEDKLVAAICAAPYILGKMGLLHGKLATCYPGFEGDLKGATLRNCPSVTDGNFITGKGPGYAAQFAMAILDKLVGSEKVAELEESTFFLSYKAK